MTISQAQAIVERVAQEYGYRPEQLVSPGRKTTLARAKREATRMISEETGLSYVEIGDVMGCDASTVNWRLRKSKGESK